jgi:hypothetical protein
MAPLELYHDAFGLTKNLEPNFTFSRLKKNISVTSTFLSTPLVQCEGKKHSVAIIF